MNAAAVGVPHDDDVVDVEVLHAVFHRGEDGVRISGMVCSGHKRRNASHHKKVARATAHQNRRVRSRVAAGDDEGFRALAVRKTVEELVFLEQIGFLEVVKAFD